MTKFIVSLLILVLYWVYVDEEGDIQKGREFIGQSTISNIDFLPPPTSPIYYADSYIYNILQISDYIKLKSHFHTNCLSHQNRYTISHTHIYRSLLTTLFILAFYKIIHYNIRITNKVITNLM